MGPIKTLRSRSGDTLVEVMASIFIFLLMMGILQGAVSYSSASMRKNQEIRQENAEILKKLSMAQAAPGTTGRISRLIWRFALSMRILPRWVPLQALPWKWSCIKKRQRMFPFFCITHRRSQTVPAPMRTEVTRHEKKEA